MKRTARGRFTKGTSGNPKGRPVLSADLKSAQKLNKTYFEQRINELLFSTREQLDFCLADRNSTAIDLILVKVIFEAIQRGDPKRIEFVLERVLGKPSRPEAAAEISVYANIMERIREKKTEP